MNQLTIIGNLVRDPELRTTQSGFNVCTFTVAVNRKAKGEHNSADFFRVSAWRQLGENCHKFLEKGRKVAVVGEVSVNTYTTQNGETRANMEVLAHEVEFLSSRNEENVYPAEPAHQQKHAHDMASYQVVDGDDLPY